MRRHFGRWLARRIPPARSVTLDQRRIFIFPSLPGLFFALLLLLILLDLLLVYQLSLEEWEELIHCFLRPLSLIHI